MEVYKLASIDELIKKVITEPNYFDVFVKEITVNTTEMFRDPAVWKQLRETVIPELKKLDTINIWHSACSTGEEVFSMAILLKEEGLWDKTKFYATDINEDVVSLAKKGLYPTRNIEQHTKNYIDGGGKKKLEDYFESGKYECQFDLNLLKNVSFKTLDLIQGECPGNFDLILCRNVLIYFNLPLQNEIIGKFSKCLNQNGFLVVGAKETIAWCSNVDAYSTFAFKEKIYQVK